METIQLKKWEEFDDEIQKDLETYETKKKELEKENRSGFFSNLLFRGQSRKTLISEESRIF